mgnify:FL=1
MYLKLAIVAVFAALSATSFAQVRLTGSILPEGRMVRSGETATVFATVINYGSEDGTNCEPFIPYNEPENQEFSYTAIDNRQLPMANANTPVDVAAGASQQFVLAYTLSTWRTRSLTRPLQFRCDQAVSSNQRPPSEYPYTFVADGEVAPNILAVSVTPSGDQILRPSRAGGWSVMAIAATNLGDSSEIWVEGYLTSRETVDGEVLICETDASAQCRFDRQQRYYTYFQSGAVRTYNVYVRNTDGWGAPFLPETNRVRVVFSQEEGSPWSRYEPATSAAFLSPEPIDSGLEGVWYVTASGHGDPNNWRSSTYNFTSELLIVPREGDSTGDDAIVVFAPLSGNGGGLSLELDRLPDFSARIDFEGARVAENRLRFRPDVELGSRFNTPGTHRYRYPDDTSDNSVMFFGPPSEGRAMVSENFPVMYPHAGCDRPCASTPDRLSMSYRLQGQRLAQRNQGIQISDFAGRAEEVNASGDGTARFFDLQEDGSFQANLSFRFEGSPNERVCQVTGQLRSPKPAFAGLEATLHFQDTWRGNMRVSSWSGTS